MKGKERNRARVFDKEIRYKEINISATSIVSDAPWAENSRNEGLKEKHSAIAKLTARGKKLRERKNNAIVEIAKKILDVNTTA